MSRRPSPPTNSPSTSASEYESIASISQSSARRRRQRQRRASLRRQLFLPLLAIGGVGLWIGGSWFWRDARAVPQRGQVGGTDILTSFKGPIEQCDVLVVGGTPSGVAAALAAARRGSNVFLVDEHAKLGGDVVYAMLNMFDVPMRPRARTATHGIFEEFFAPLGTAFDIKAAEDLFETKVYEAERIQVVRQATVVQILKREDQVLGVVVRQPAPQVGQPAPERLIIARCTVDATNDAVIAARAGAGYYIGRENANPDKRMQAAGLLFSVKGVNWRALTDFVYSRRLVKAQLKPNGALVPGDALPATPHARALIEAAKQRFSHISDLPHVQQAAAIQNLTPHTKKDLKKLPTVDAWLRMGGGQGKYLWDRGYLLEHYKPKNPNVMFLSINCGKQDDGSVVLNTLNIVDVDGLDAKSRARARNAAVQELPLFLAYLRKTMPGFEKAQLAQIAPELYIRETRHIHGYYSLKVSDVQAGKRFFDRIGKVSYPLDLHPYVKGELNAFAPRRYTYTLPLRCMVPRKVNNLLVASRSLSATYSAAGSARVIPVTMAAGEAAGVAAWMCATQVLTPHQMMKDSSLVSHLQKLLRESKVDIGDDLGDAPRPPSDLLTVKREVAPPLVSQR